MIIYDLTCICGYQFEAWFENRSDYDEQCKSDLLQCPDCGGTAIHKILSPVAGVKHSTSVAKKPSSSIYEPAQLPGEKEVKEFIETVSTYVKENYEDVGTNLAEKALKMHYGVEEEKKIRGVATAQEEKMLLDEGIELVKFPLPINEAED